MHRFYCPIQNISQNTITISDKTQIHHIRDVLRLKCKDTVVIFDGKSNEYRAEINKLLTQRIIFKIKEIRKFISAKKTMITIACAIPKKSKMDDIVDKLTQLGVDRIVPLETERVVIKLDKYKKILRQRHWEKIAICASQQSQRKDVPVIEQIKDIKTILSESQDFDLKLIPTLTDNPRSLKEIIVQSKPKNILVLIGPEGDFSSSEIALAKQAGCIPVSLGELVLRVETAAIAAVSFIRLLYENN